MRQFEVTKLVEVAKDGKVTIPYTVSLRLVHSKFLKAVVKIDYAGIIINDIYIINRQGRIEIRYPDKQFEDKKTGKQKRVTVVFPRTPELSREFNQAILKAYTEACEEELLSEKAA